MYIFAIIFALAMISMSIIAVIVIDVYAGGFWGEAAFVVLLVVLYRAGTHQSGADHPIQQDALNAFQQPLK